MKADSKTETAVMSVISQLVEFFNKRDVGRFLSFFAPDPDLVFIGTGEHSSDFEKFEPAGFISRLLGMGDIKSLLEKAEESLKGKDAEKTARRIMSGKFTLHDMYDQMGMLSGMGSLKKIAEMLPGGFLGKAKMKQEDMDNTENKLQKFRVIMDSMTDEEMNEPNIVRASRIKRIARGAGVENKNVKELLKYYNMTKRMMKGFSGNNINCRMTNEEKK